jgi:succinyl-CoA synthetase beta subunit
MAKLYEYQGKELLKKAGIGIPRGEIAKSKEGAKQIAEKLGRPVVLKAQAWVTGRAQAGGILFALDPGEAQSLAGRLLGMVIKGFTVNEVLVEERLDLVREFYLGVIIDDVSRSPVLIFGAAGGTGIEERAGDQDRGVVKVRIDISEGLAAYQARNLLRKAGIQGSLQNQLTEILVRFYRACRNNEARSAEINPLVLTADGRIMAADCHMVIDDYAVFRHPELGIPIAREFDRPPTDLERIAYQVEAKDHRGTFYFLQMASAFDPRTGFIGFHGAGGGGAMMSMDALLKCGFKIANYCDTSGNPSAAKVYRAARIILSQRNIDGYFASGSGVASQEQFHSARGLVKAFREMNLGIPAVIRIGGNSEEQAIHILKTYTQDLPGQVEAYGRNTSAAFCAARLKALSESWDYASARKPGGTGAKASLSSYSFETLTGSLLIDHEKCRACGSRPCVEACKSQVLRFEGPLPVLAIPANEARKGKCTECLACELGCQFHGNKALSLDLPIPGLQSFDERGA